MAIDPPPRRAPQFALPTKPFLPGSGDPRPELPEADPGSPANWWDSDAFAFGLDLHHGGCSWEAHEVWESVWLPLRSAAPIDAALVRGLIQVAAVHVLTSEGRDSGARAVAARALGALSAGAGAAAKADVDLDRVRESVEGWTRGAPLPTSPLRLV